MCFICKIKIPITFSAPRQTQPVVVSAYVNLVPALRGRIHSCSSGPDLVMPKIVNGPKTIQYGRAAACVEFNGGRIPAPVEPTRD